VGGWQGCGFCDVDCDLTLGLTTQYDTALREWTEKAEGPETRVNSKPQGLR